MRSLNILHLGRNLLEGELPAELGWLSELEVLDVGGNKLTGKLPAEWEELKKLKRLILFGNKFSGRIPDEWEGMERLEDFLVQGNELTGKVPDFLFHLPTLKRLWLGNNFLELTEEQKELTGKDRQHLLLPQGKK